MERPMEDIEDVSLGIVYSQDGLNYYSILPVKDARSYEQFVLSLGCTVKKVYILRSEERMRAFIQLENDYRKNVWAAMPKAHLH